jgi:hypothetical protein
MPVTVKGSGGGGVTLDAGAAASNTTLTLPNTDGAVINTAPGTSGNVLTSNGTAWTSAAPTLAVINTQTFDASGTWTKPAGYSASSRVLVQAWGAGGSGGRNTTATSASGGGGGGYIERWLNLSQLGATETITIGAGGAARTATNQAGAVGGNTTVGSLVTAYGGGGGGSVANASGGGGGGQLSAGTTASTTNVSTAPGRPFISVQDTDGTGGSAGNPRQGAGCSTLSDSSGDAQSALIHGGGGGAGVTNVNGASSVYGGGGGGGGTTGTGGTSLFGGNGGAAGANGTNGTQPGGGGGAATGTSGAGGNGRVIITIFPA